MYLKTSSGKWRSFCQGSPTEKLMICCQVYFYRQLCHLKMVMAQYNDVISAPLRLKSPAIRSMVFHGNQKGNHILVVCEVDPPVIGRFPIQMVSNTDFFHFMTSSYQCLKCCKPLMVRWVICAEVCMSCPAIFPCFNSSMVVITLTGIDRVLFYSLRPLNIAIHLVTCQQWFRWWSVALEQLVVNSAGIEWLAIKHMEIWSSVWIKKVPMSLS